MKRLLAVLFLLASPVFAQPGHGPISGGSGGSSGPATALQSPVVIEGTADAFEGNFTFADPTADWTWAWGADGTLTGPLGGVVIGPSSATDNAIVRFDATTGKLVQTSNLTCSDVSGVTTTLATITPAATTGATVAGQALAITASPAVASTDTAGAAAGGSVTITAGAAARNTSGNANGGDINLVPGAGIGTGTVGQVILNSTGTNYPKPGLAWSGDSDTGFTSEGVAGSTAYVADGAKSILFSGAGITAAGKIITAATFTATTQVDGGGTSFFRGEIAYLFAALSLSASPTTLTQAFSNMVVTNEGDTAEHVVNLPTAVAGTKFSFIVQDADGIKVVAAAGDTIRPIAGTAASAAAGFIRCATQGAFITLVAINATEWVAIGSAGVWTIDI
jgi:hypothetical protein